jgi:hypothetical protein
MPVHSTIEAPDRPAAEPLLPGSREPTASAKISSATAATRALPCAGRAKRATGPLGGSAGYRAHSRIVGGSCVAADACYCWCLHAVPIASVVASTKRAHTHAAVHRAERSAGASVNNIAIEVKSDGVHEGASA